MDYLHFFFNQKNKITMFTAACILLASITATIFVASDAFKSDLVEDKDFFS